MKNNPVATTTKDIADVITSTVDSITDYLKHKEVQKTERERIEACLNAITKKMETDRIKFEKYMEKSFEDRERLYKRVDGLLESAANKGDIEMAKLALNFLINVYNKNPMEGLNDSLDNGINIDLLSASGKNYLE